MDILVYKDLSYSGLNKQYKKTIAFLKNDDFVSADMEYVKETQVTTELYLPASALQTTSILAVLNPWMASVNKTAVTV